MAPIQNPQATLNPPLPTPFISPKWVAKTTAFMLTTALLAFSGCATQRYLYLPATAIGSDTSHPHQGRASYSVPVEAPEGNVRVMSAGIVQLRPRDGGARIPALHIKMVVSNHKGAASWVVDPHAQSISLPNGGGKIVPIFVEGAPSAATPITLAGAEMRALDLYFPLPPGQASETSVPEFDLHWQVQAGAQLVQETTSFDRVAKPTYSSYPYGYPPAGTYDPYYGGAYYQGYSSGYYPGYPGYYGPYGSEWGQPPIVIERPAPAAPPSRPVIIHR